MKDTKEIVIFETADKSITLPVALEKETVWLTQMQMSTLFSVDRTVITRHKCAVCGRSELDDDNLEFRFCSKCNGNYEYCSDHLFTHPHVQ